MKPDRDISVNDPEINVVVPPYISSPRVIATSNKQVILELCNDILIRELKVLSEFTNADTMEEKACRRIEVVTKALEAVR